MKTAKLFKHGGSQAVRLPKAFRFPGSEVFIEKQGDEVVLRPVTRLKFKSFTEIARHLDEAYPDAQDFPEPPPRPLLHDRPILDF
ncbi:MAG: antitoxin [Verrucomicrobiales bacterium]